MLVIIDVNILQFTIALKSHLASYYLFALYMLRHYSICHTYCTLYKIKINIL